MKLPWKKLAAPFFLTLILGFANNDIIELEGYLNARSSANFLKNTNNVKYTLAPGTKAKIQESKKFSSGNYGLKVEITSGPRKGESVWVYYRTADPDMKVYASDSDAAKDKETTDVEKAKATKTKRETAAIKDPDSDKEAKPKVTGKKGDKELSNSAADELTKKIADANKKIQGISKSDDEICPTGDCGLKKKTYMRDHDEVSDFKPLQSADGPLRKKIENTENRNDGRSCNQKDRESEIAAIRKGRTLPYYSCYFGFDKDPGQFRFSNSGPNNIVPSPKDVTRKEIHGRDWSFSFEANARQDLGFTVMDGAHQQSHFMIFPRTTLPTIRVEGNKKIVTLPNGETVTYDLKTSQIIGGVLSEKAISDKGMPNVSYGGNGVMVRIDTSENKDPRLAKEAVIQKGTQTCRVPASELWPDRRLNSSLHFKFFSDKDFANYLSSKSACKGINFSP